MITGHKYVVCAENARGERLFVDCADTIEEARRIKFDGELAGFTHPAIIEGNLNRVE